MTPPTASLTLMQFARGRSATPVSSTASGRGQPQLRRRHLRAARPAVFGVRTRMAALADCGRRGARTQTAIVDGAMAKGTPFAHRLSTHARRSGRR